MAEAIRSFPDRPVNAAQFDPSVSALYRRVKAELAKQGSGTLEVTVDDPASALFLDDQFIASGAAKLDHLAPGRYRLLVAKSPQPGRVREIDVAPGRTTTVHVDWKVEGALRTSGGVVALDVDKSASGEAELEAAMQLGLALGAHHVVVLAVRPVNGRRAVVGYAVGESQDKTYAAVQLGPIAPTAETLGRLAAVLAGDKSVEASGLITTEPVESPPEESHPLGARRTASIVVGGVALATLVGAVGFELSSRSTYDQSKAEYDDAKQRSLYDSANRKYRVAQGLAIGGAALVVGAAVLWFAGGPQAEEERGVAIAPVATPEGFSLVVMGRF